MAPIETYTSRPRSRRNSHTPLISPRLTSTSPTPTQSIKHFSLLAAQSDTSLPLSFSSNFHRRGAENSRGEGEIEHRLEDSSGSEEECSDTSSLEARNNIQPASLPIENGSASRASYPESNLRLPYEQEIVLEEEDLRIVITGYRSLKAWTYLYHAFCVITLGVLALVGRWVPRFWIYVTAETCDLDSAEWLAVENEWGDLTIEKINRKYYGGTLGSVFVPDKSLPQLNYFDYKYIRFIFHPLLQKFVQNSHWKDTAWVTVNGCKRGLTRDQLNERKLVYGDNVIDIKERPVMQLLTDEVLHPFYVFQIFSVTLWMLDDYYYYAVCIFIISATSIITTLVETRKNARRMSEMSRFVCDVKVYRNNHWKLISSEDLVPGDVFEVNTNEFVNFPCDGVLLDGDCIVNESMLTGESVPVSKIPIVNSALVDMNLSTSNVHPSLAKYFLFSGTKIIRVRAGSDANTRQSSLAGKAIALVVRTGFNTTKGALVRSMLFPKPNKFAFYRDSFRFIGVLACIAAVGFMMSVVNFIKLGVHWEKIIVRALDLITIVVPPALPATMSIGTTFAISRLRKCGIFCISPSRVNVCGKINAMCFDKTGTLTEDGLDVLGVQVIDQQSRLFSELHRSVENLQSSTNEVWGDLQILHAMTTCHSLKLIDGELMGDPLDLKMFEFTRWILEEGTGPTLGEALGKPPKKDRNSTSGLVPTVVRPPGGKRFDLDAMLTKSDDEPANSFLELGVIRCFEFISSLRRMSVIVKRLGSTSMEIFVKGAPEVMIDICRPESLPHDYHEILQQYTHHGYRVIACAAKSLPSLNWLKAQRIKREQVEAELQFIGFIIFENKLKPTTASVINTLSNASIRQIMCTGDNVLTAISVSKECGLVHPEAEVYVPRFTQGSSNTPRSIISWENIDGKRSTLDAITLRPVEHRNTPYRTSFLGENYALAITGEIFRWMVDYAPLETFQRMLIKGQIFARMSPDEKHELVEKLQGINYCVGFCGDGANDCGALKAADVGISLSEAEASVAAPFTSRSTDIGCVLQVIREGRAALVTSFGCFKYMALYSLIQFTSVGLLYGFDSTLGDFQFLFIDLFVILPIAVFMARTASYPKIHRKRPTANLVSKKVITSLIGHIFIHALVQVSVFRLVQTKTWYLPPTEFTSAKNVRNFENTSLFLISCFQYILTAIVFNVGPPYRRSMFSNRPFVITIFILLIFSVYIVMYPSKVIMNILDLLGVPLSYRLNLLFVASLNFAVSMVAEKYVFPNLVQWVVHAWHLRKGAKYRPLSKSPKKIYKRIEEEMKES
ncbi:hypothetical protein K493DRAFT_240394 [Basidiobolus meristosporus CBS 931.73]|uniref:Cation-transporting ATPase n=1 Tax=Basidiobolus meristosporus CBS 931.73 TaxID=1314790 RepID=A0A1Y1XB53_9FUNG|nr:hypothetical protein K493DRAFT_240394 [Basidiobolus meristosporus CBS 931.73]|eukprot:ORX82959.1 hypothetical protein K493DRAFT_240394 [Basidiobolus meristosporus CBS 931.73]